MADNLIAVHNLSFTYTHQLQPALSHISFTVERGSWTTIIGRNGSGKSTLIKLLTGLLINQTPNAINLFKEKVTEDNLDHMRSRIGLVFQNPDNQFVGPTVADDVAFGLENHGLSRQDMQPRVEKALKQVGMLDFYDWEPMRLSGGQKQRAALAGVLVLQPELIILDEATSMIDPAGRKSLLALVHRLQKELGLTVLSVTHDIEETTLADHILVMQAGEIVLQGSPAQVFSQDRLLIELGLDLPLSRLIQRDLLDAAIELPTDYLSEKELIDRLCQLYSTK